MSTRNRGKSITVTVVLSIYVCIALKQCIRVLITNMRRDYVSVKRSNCQDRVVTIHSSTYVLYKKVLEERIWSTIGTLI